MPDVLTIYTKKFRRQVVQKMQSLARLHGLFVTYKLPGLKWEHLWNMVKLQVLKSLSARKPPAPEQHVHFLLGLVVDSNDKELTLTATRVPALTSHLLVGGQKFTSLKVDIGHWPEALDSGVLGLGMVQGCRLLSNMYDAHLTKDYTLHGILGKAIDDICEDRRPLEKTTYGESPQEPRARGGAN
ncbi:PREDICTED: probable tRNA pseudouridine synthase 2-like [Chrysochloris asiatica]|uniref:Probable tRNA pseudouridine synthase 2-like n=1 Tax=Chrysochloris asiatica TaxID=185453 RepID=A0A9B0TEU5_CHRAS|nr:PREDICTED: probable tRNA pseudouridine synthase 2-like [Chrysochloris asiatica]